MKRRSQTRSESGVSLIMVLVALTVFGLLVPVLGQFGAVNGVSGYIVKGQRFDRYAADNGVQGAIAKAQTIRTMGREYVPCPDVTSTMNVGSTAFRRDVRVACKGFAGSGVPVGGLDTPAYAVLGLDTNQPSIDVGNGGTLKTAGAWWANGKVGSTSADVGKVAIDARADLFGATGSCKVSPGGVVLAAAKRCPTGETVPTPLDLGTSLTAADLAGLSTDTGAEIGDACAAISLGNGVVRLKSGIHWNVAWLNGLTDGRCDRDVVIVLQTGPHYFDFNFYDRLKNQADENKWTIRGGSRSRVTVVGGTLTTDAAGAYSAASHANDVAAPGACDLGSPGVELVLGSRSNISVESPAHVELCPLQPPGGGQRISVSGPISGTADPQQQPVRTSKPTTAVGNGDGDPFNWQDSPPASIDPLLNQDCGARPPCTPDQYKEGELSGRRGSATITMQIPNPFTENARIDELKLDVTHREFESGDAGNDDNGRDRISRLWFTVDGLGQTARCDDLPPRNDWAQRPVDCNVSDLKFPMPDPQSVPTLDVVMHIETNRGDRGSVTVGLDHVALSGKQTTAKIREQACDCPAFAVDNNGQGNAASAFVWGTVVLPTADVREDFSGSTTFRLERGVVARRFQLENLPNDPNFIPVSLPGGGIYSKRTVEFEARINDKPKLRARVTFPDPVGDPLNAPAIVTWDTHP